MTVTKEINEQSMLHLKTVVPYLRSIWTTSPTACGAAFLLLILGGLFEGFGLLMLVPVLSYIGVGAEQSNRDGLLGDFNHFIQSMGLQASPELLLATVFVILILRALINYAGLHITSSIEARYQHQMRADIYGSLTTASWRFLSRQSTSKMAHAVTIQSENVAEGAEIAVYLLAAVVSLIVGLGLATILSPKLTAVVFIIGAVIFFAMGFFNRRTAKIAGDEDDRTAVLFKQIEGHFSGLKAIKLLSAEHELTDKFLTNSQQLSKANRNGALNDGQATLFFQAASAAFLIALVYLSIQFFPNQNLEIILFIVIFSRLAPKTNTALSYLRALLGVVVEYDRSKQLVDDANAYREKTHRSKSRIQIKQGLSFKNVSFCFEKSGDRRQLRNITLDIKSGTSLGIIGRSGEGKTTFVDLMCGLIKPSKGEVLIDGVVLNENNRSSWLASTTYISQDDFLFDGSIAENLRLGNPSSTDEDLWVALKHAGIDEFIGGLKYALHTNVGSRGAMLSRGQRQRLCLARGLLAKPEFLILDEALNALNPRDEYEIMETVRGIPEISNLIVVSHRLASLDWVDSIIVIQNGTIADQGPFTKFSKSGIDLTRFVLE